MKFRIGFTSGILLGSLLVLSVYRQFQSGFEATIATNQVNDSTFQYGLSRSVAEGNIEKVFLFLVFATLCLIWVPFIAKKLIRRK